MEKPIKTSTSGPKKRKKKSKIQTTGSEPKIMKLSLPKSDEPTLEKKATVKNDKSGDLNKDEIEEKYPVLKNKALVERFLKVPLSNNQKGRIRQALRDNLKSTDNTLMPDIIHSKIQTIIKGSVNLSDSELRRVRVLYNFLQTSLQPKKVDSTDKKPKKKKKKTKQDDNAEDIENKDKKEKKENIVNKVKGPKRYVVFVGNLPLDTDKEKIMQHFADVNEYIKDIRIPKSEEEKKTAIAFIELQNEASFELALSKHHTMLDNRRINVLYTAQKNGKISKTEAKSKSAKLIALQKSGKLIGSVPLNKKRSHRRMILKKARAKEAAE